MCTAILRNKSAHLFGRTLDVEARMSEEIVITPRRFRIGFAYEEAEAEHTALIGTALMRNGMPLYYDAMNEYGLAAVALSFVGNAVYRRAKEGARNVASFELISWVLTKCKTLSEARELLSGANVTAEAFDAGLAPSPLHWMIADKSGALTVEPLAEGLRIYENKVGVLTNNPPFSYHLTHLCDYMSLSPAQPENTVCPSADLKPYSRGMGALGLPGDASSASRFVRAAFLNAHTASPTESGEVSTFFHIMDGVAQPLGCSRTGEGKNTRTLYTSCMDMDALTYSFTTYNNRRIREVRLSQSLLDTSSVTSYPMYTEEDVYRLN